MIELVYNCDFYKNHSINYLLGDEFDGDQKYF